MARSLANILDQITRLQKEADAMQHEVIARIRKEIAQFQLTPEQLFGAAATGRGRKKAAPAGKTAKPSKPAKTAKPPKFADGAGNTWGGMGKRPEWLRQAIEAGHAIDEFLIAKPGGKAVKAVKAKAAKPAARKKAAATKTRRKSSAAKTAAPTAD